MISRLRHAWAADALVLCFLLMIGTAHLCYWCARKMVRWL